MALMSDTNEDAPLRYILQLEQRLQTLANDLGEVRGAYIRETNNRYHRLAGEQLVQQLCNMCIGIAKHRCKQLSYPAPENAYTAFERLAEADTDSTNTINWKQIIGMRNALVHDYLNINPEVIETLIREQQYLPLVRFALGGLVKLGE
jgi:uncharacterized protein YutE (UPF0331/DUF86 family)|tara:strand:- start:28 stop:471 length:444 start_codon:yes stop_codon:yes gene_type:complete